MRLNKTRAIVSLIFFLYPLGALPLIFIEIYNQKKYAFTLLALFMGIVAYLAAPTGDLYMHYADYLNYKNISIAEFFNLLPLKFDIILYSISFIFSKIGIPFEFIRLLFVFFSYQIIFSIFHDIIKNHPKIQYKRSLYFTFFLIFYFQVLFMVVSIGLRNGFAIYLALFGTYKIFENQNKKGWYFIVLGILTHFSILLLLIPIILVKIFKIKINIIVVVFSSALSLISLDLFSFILKSLPLNDFVKFYIDGYVNGYWAQDFLKDSSFLFLISKYLAFIAILPLLFSLFIIKGKSALYQLCLILSILLFVIYPMTTVLFRYTNFIVFVFIIWFICNYEVTQMRRIILYLLLICTTVTFTLGSIYTFRKNFEISNENLLLFNSYPVLLSAIYGEDWVESHITKNGDIIK